MAQFSVIAKNDKLEQINNIDDLQYAFEMYKYLAIEMDFPDVKLIDNETAEVLLYIKRESTTYEYISPLLMKAFQEGEENADTPIEPNGTSEETALSYDEYQAKYNALNSECRELIDYIWENSGFLPADVVTALEDIYNKINIQAYSLEELLELKKILKNLSEKC